MQKILIARYLEDVCLQGLTAEFEFIHPTKEQNCFSRQELLERVGDCQALFCCLNPCDKQLIDQGVQLKAISNMGVGYDNIDWQYATEKGIAVVNTPSSVTAPTADLTMGLLLSALRRISYYDRRLRSQKLFATELFYDGSTHVEDKLLGLIGFGRIGKAVAARAAAFGMKIAYYDPFRAAPEAEAALQATYMELDQLLATADVISLHLPYAPAARHLINGAALARMKPSAYLINAARGPIVEEAALITALQQGSIRGAALDVYEFEPKVPQELLELDNVVLVPHIGTMAWEARMNMAREALDGLAGVLRGEKPANVVNRTVLD